VNTYPETEEIDRLLDRLMPAALESERAERALEYVTACAIRAGFSGLEIVGLRAGFVALRERMKRVELENPQPAPVVQVPIKR